MEIVHEKYRERYRLLGLRIAYYRKRKGYTQEQFAELIGKSWSFISQVEANNGATLEGHLVGYPFFYVGCAGGSPQ